MRTQQVLAAENGNRVLAHAPREVVREEYYVEKRGRGEWAVQRKDAERASAILPTQAQAIARAKELAPDRRPQCGAF
jgi:hypothetical protein